MDLFIKIMLQQHVHWPLAGFHSQVGLLEPTETIERKGDIR